MEIVAHRLYTPQGIRTFMFAGNARLTLVSRVTGGRFTYRVRKSEADKPWFVSVLTGHDNEADYTFLGTIFESGDYRYAQRSKIGRDAASAKAFDWFYRAMRADKFPRQLEVWHEGRCGRCGRVLTVPESIASGFGPECIGKI